MCFCNFSCFVFFEYYYVVSCLKLNFVFLVSNTFMCSASTSKLSIICKVAFLIFVYFRFFHLIFKF